MKYSIFIALVVMSNPEVLFAHDGSAHVDTAWYQDPALLVAVAGVVVLTAILIASKYVPKYRTVFMSLGVVSVLFAFVGVQLQQTAPAPVAATVMETLNGVPVTVYRTAGCSCCGGYAEELSDTGADVTVETVSATEMQSLKTKHQIALEQESCHTSIIGDYVVEGHVPFAAVAKLIVEQPAVSGLTLPGMPIGTPGMPGRQTEVYNVTTLENQLFWQSS